MSGCSCGSGIYYSRVINCKSKIMLGTAERLMLDNCNEDTGMIRVKIFFAATSSSSALLGKNRCGKEYCDNFSESRKCHGMSS